MKKTTHSFSRPQKAGRVFTSKFAQQVYAVVARIPKGKTMTYRGGHQGG